MGNGATTATRDNRTLTGDFHDASTDFQLMHDGQAFVACVLAFILSLGFPLAHKATCPGGGGLPRHSPYARVRLGGLTVWRLQGTACQAVFTIVPPCVVRDRTMRPEAARQALIAIPGGLSLAWCAPLCHLSPLALSRVICALGQQSRVTVLPRCGLPLPTSLLADEQHRRGLPERVSLPAIVKGRVLWHRRYRASKSAAALAASYGACQRAALAQGPSYQVRGALTDGFDSTVSSRRTLFPGARLGFCLRHALHKLPRTLVGVSAPIRKGLRSQFHALRHRCRPRTSLRVVAWGQCLRHCAKRIDTAVGQDHGERVRHWCEAKNAGGYADTPSPADAGIRRRTRPRSVSTNGWTSVAMVVHSMSGFFLTTL